MKDRLKSLLNTKSKKICAAIISVAIIVAAATGVYALTKEKEITVALNKDKQKIVIEYGSTIDPKLEEYLDLSKLDKEDKEKVLKESTLTSTIKNEDSKEYPGIGSYEIKITYKEQKLKSKVEIKDTTAPVFNEINEVSFEEKTEFDYPSVISATDLQEVTIEFDTTNVNKDATGEYTVKAIAKDKSGNETTKDIKVIVTAKPIVEEKPSTNTGGSNVGAGSTNKPSTSGGTPNKPSNGGSSSSGGSGSNTGGTTTPPTKPETPHAHNGTPIEGMLFNSGGELDAWAGEYIERVYDKTPYSTWGSRQCTCGKWYITYFK